MFFAVKTAENLLDCQFLTFVQNWNSSLLVLWLTMTCNFIEAVRSNEGESWLLHERARRWGTREVIELAAGLASNTGAEMFAVHTFLDHAVYNRLELKLNNVYNTRRNENMCHEN